MSCRVCGGEVHEEFRATLLGAHDVRYDHCDGCGLLQTEPPYWLEEAYRTAINVSDTGILRRNILLSHKVAVVIHHCFDEEARFVDYAGGHGFLTRLMRDIGYDFYWHDPRCENLVARGFEHDGTTGVELVTAFEVLEHAADPVGLLEEMLEIADTFLLTTELLPEPVPRPDAWWYYGLEHGQHVTFVTARTLQRLAARLGLTLYSAGEVHLMTRVSLSVPASPSGRLVGALVRRPGIAGTVLRSLLPLDFQTLIERAELLFPAVSRQRVPKTHDDMLLLRSRLLDRQRR